MLNASDAPSSDVLKVIDYADPRVAADMASGVMNTGEAQLLKNVAASIRRGHTQWRAGPVRPERICLVGSGPSLADTEDELRQAVWDGAVLVTMNGAYHWCIAHGLQPRTQIVMDARASNARFLEPAVPRCNYVLASQCAPELWDAVEGREHVWIFHAVVKQEGAVSDLLDRFYLDQWLGIGGGTTVATRAISLLRTAGYVRFDLHGVDCCRMGAQHHAVAQPENDRDKYVTVRAGVRDRPDSMREFSATHWQIKQMEDALVMLKVNGQHFVIQVHGDGMLAHVMNELGAEDPDTLVIEERV